MIITEKLAMTKRNDGTVVIELSGANPTTVQDDKWITLYDSFRRVAPSDRENALKDMLASGTLTEDMLVVLGFVGGDDGVKAKEYTAEELLVRGLTSLMNFFKEFEFEPNFRFTNTLAYKIAESKTSAKAYVENYFALMDSAYKNEIVEKMKSKEFGLILDDIAKGGVPTNRVNTRFKVYYGSAGTGKTTLGMEESKGKCIVCNASMLPSDLMEDFVFANGQPSFSPSTLWNCMTEGKPIVLDEINLLPFDSLRFLQGILDGKKEFDYKGKKVEIADGFEVIGTMNLSIGGMTYGLPEPLVDRSADMKKFSLTAEQLSKAILG